MQRFVHWFNLKEKEMLSKFEPNGDCFLKQIIATHTPQNIPTQHIPTLHTTHTHNTYPHSTHNIPTIHTTHTQTPHNTYPHSTHPHSAHRPSIQFIFPPYFYLGYKTITYYILLDNIIQLWGA